MHSECRRLQLVREHNDANINCFEWRGMKGSQVRIFDPMFVTMYA